jgi:type I restriction enzyme S subunit
LESGHTPSRKKPEYWNGDVPWVGIRDATENHGRVITSTKQRITEEGLNNSSARLLPPHTVCLSRTASVGYVITMGVPMATSQDFINWVCGPQLSPKYLHYILMSEQEAIRRFAHGTTHQTVYYPEAKAFHVCIPDRAEQDRVAATVGALDDKIAANERISKTSEALGSHLFEKIFPEAIDFALNQTPLPEGWASADLAHLAPEVETGRRPKGGVAKYTFGIPSIGAESITRLGEFDFTKVKYVPEEFFLNMKSGIIKDRDILVYKDGGKPGDFKPKVSMFGHGFPFDKMAINEHVYRVRMIPELGQDFGYYWLSSKAVMGKMRNLGTGVAIPGINSTAFKSLPVVSPPTELVQHFNDAVAPLTTSALNAAAESRTLAELRDTLLPQLMSGKLRVRDAEKIVEDNV